MSGLDPILLVAWCGAILGPFLAAYVWRRRKRTPRGVVGLAVLALFYGLGIWGFLIEPETLVVRHVSVESPTWIGPPLKIGILSDVHVGAHVTPGRVGRVVARLSRERPDLIVYLGDYVGGHRAAARRSPGARSTILRGVEALGGGQAPLGRIAILGNHDWWYDGPAIEAELRRSNIAVLENDAVRVPRPGGPFWIAGLADMASKRVWPSTPAALRDIPADEPVIVLTHWPDPFVHVPPRVALTLAGHSHCGQVDLPLFGRPVAASPGSRRWPCGLYVVRGRQLFVTGGLGTSVLPVRFGAPPEIVVLTLSQARVGRPELP